MTMERYLLVHTAGPDGVPRPHLLPVAGLAVSMSSATLGEVTWPGGRLTVLERASFLVRTLGTGAADPSAWEQLAGRFEEAEGRASRVLLGRGRSLHWEVAEGGAAEEPVDVSALPGAHGGRREREGS